MSETETKYAGGSGHSTNVKIPETVEQEIQRKGLTAPRVTPKDIEDNIADEVFFTAAQGLRGAQIGATGPSQGVTAPLELLTFCVLVLRNGYTVHGVSACASPENFNAELGRRIARENAVREMWPLMGYALKERLSRADDALRATGGYIAPKSDER